MSKHTPGPWHTGGTAYHGADRATMNVWGAAPKGKQSGEIIAKDIPVHYARLIAAAPDLLEACGYCLKLLTDMGHGGLAGAILAKKAIAKAEGRT